MRLASRGPPKVRWSLMLYYAVYPAPWPVHNTSGPNFSPSNWIQLRLIWTLRGDRWHL